MKRSSSLRNNRLFSFWFIEPKSQERIRFCQLTANSSNRSLNPVKKYFVESSSTVTNKFRNMVGRVTPSLSQNPVLSSSPHEKRVGRGSRRGEFRMKTHLLSPALSSIRWRRGRKLRGPVVLNNLTPCAPSLGGTSPGAHGVTRPTKHVTKLLCRLTSAFSLVFAGTSAVSRI